MDTIEKKYNISQLESSKTKYNEAETQLASAKTKLESIYESINSDSFSGFDAINLISKYIEEALDGIDRTKVNISNAKNDIDMKINSNNI